MPLRYSVYDEDVRSSHQGSHQQSAGGYTDATDDDTYQEQAHASHHSLRQQHHQADLAEQHVPTTKDYVQPYGTPGPGRYDVPSTFKTPDNAQHYSGYVRASHIGASIKGRNWPTPDDPTSGGSSPGPQAYWPVLEAESGNKTAPKAVFSAAGRDNQDKLYLGSEELNKSVASADSPGPQAYRVGTGRTPGRQSPGPPIGPRATFGANCTTPHHLAAALSAASQKRSKSSLGFHPSSADAANLSTAICIGSYGSALRSYGPLRPVSCVPDPEAVTAAAAAAASRIGAGNTVGHAGSLPVDGTGADDQGASARQTGRSKSAAAKMFNSRVQEGSKREGHAWSFGPPGGLEAGKHRRRSQEGNVFISPQHAAVDPGSKVSSRIPGAGAYDVRDKLQLLSTHRAEGTTPFGLAERNKAKLYLSADLVKSDPSLTYSPGPSTAAADILGTISAAGTPHSSRLGPRFGSPPKGSNVKQPIISRQHEPSGRDSPGPAAYDTLAAAQARTVKGDRRGPHFGKGTRGVAGGILKTFAPGPGAYQTDTGKLSTHTSSPAYSLGATPRGGAQSPTPGVGAYNISTADKQTLPNSGVFTIRSKLQHGGTESTACSPGPVYLPIGGMGYEAEVDYQLRLGCQHGYGHQWAAIVEENLQQIDRNNIQNSQQREQIRVANEAAHHGQRLQLDLSSAVSQGAGAAHDGSGSNAGGSQATARSFAAINAISYRSATSMLSLGLGRTTAGGMIAQHTREHISQNQHTPDLEASAGQRTKTHRNAAS